MIEVESFSDTEVWRILVDNFSELNFVLGKFNATVDGLLVDGATGKVTCDIGIFKGLARVPAYRWRGSTATNTAMVKDVIGYVYRMPVMEPRVFSFTPGFRVPVKAAERMFSTYGQWLEEK